MTEQYAEKLDLDGVVVIKRAYNPKDIKRLKTMYDKMFTEGINVVNNGFHKD